MAYDRTKGLYTFPVPDHYESPTLILSREDGADVIQAAKENKNATIVLNSNVEKSEASDFSTLLFKTIVAFLFSLAA